ncbi:MAG: hypothetical protein PHV74_04215 [Dehalococcoidia bacterium]|nr:hypothetical protein [Dehalococcoidia bacterium]
MKSPLARFSMPYMIIVIAFVLVSLCLFINVSPISASPGLNVTGSLVDVTISPGQSYVHTMDIASGSTYSMDMQVEIRGFGQSLDGSTIELTPEDDNSLYSARSFITRIDNTSFHLEPGGSQQVKATISVPAGTAPGTRYAVIYIHSQPGGEGKVGVVVAVDVPVIVHIPGTDTAVRKGEITDLDVPKIEAGKPIQILTTFKNTGDIHFKAKNQVSIADESGQVILQAETPLSSSSVIPAFSRLFTATLVLPESMEGLPAGRYFAESKVTLDDGTLLDTKETSFDIEASYQAPPTSTPSASATTPALISQSTPAPSTSTSSDRGISWSLMAIIIASIVTIGAIVIALIVTRRRQPLPK